ncbi:MAG: PDZ domain-containing protein [Candidatus Zixiibacteriota bacterium]
MKINKFAVICLVVTLCLASSLWAEKEDFQKVFKKVNPHLVTVEYKAEMNFMGQSEDIEGRVPGIIIEGNMVIFDGTSLGAGHFNTDMFGTPQVDKPKSLKITDYKDVTYDAEFIGVDDYSSIAFCRLPDSAKNKVEPAEFKDVGLELGQDVFIFWMLPKTYLPRFQMSETVVTAVLEKPEKFYLFGELSQDFIMAPVVTEDGEMAGVITPVSQTSGFTPFDFGNIFGNPVGLMPHKQFDELLSNPPEADKFKRGWLGVSLQALDPEVAKFWNLDVPGGIILTDIIDKSPAQEAGLKTGDFIIQLNGEPIEVTQDENLSVFQKKVSAIGAGNDVTLLTVRPKDGGVDTNFVTMMLAERPVSASDAPDFEDKNFDLTVRDMVFADYNNRSLKEGEIEGVVVDKCEQGGWAAVGGIDPGMIIVKINDRQIASIEDYKTIMAEVENNKDKEVVFMIWRANKTQFVHVKTHWED